MNRTVISLAGLLLFAAPALHPAAAADAGDAASGQALAEKSCANCHAVGKKSTSKLPIAPPFRGFSSKWPGDELEKALTERVVSAHPPMPIFKQLGPQQISALAAYMRTLGN